MPTRALAKGFVLVAASLLLALAGLEWPFAAPASSSPSDASSTA